MRGSATESFARKGRILFHGNQILAGQLLGYDTERKFRQSDHTLTNIFDAIDRTFVGQHGASKAKAMFACHLVLDALIGNTDRHHENWGVLVKQVGDAWQGILAPTFDHASSLGRELQDSADGKCRERLLRERGVGIYSERAHGAIFWDKTDSRGLSPLELVRRAAALYPEIFRAALGLLSRIDYDDLDSIVGRIPEDWMTRHAREFSVELICYNINELRNIKQ